MDESEGGEGGGPDEVDDLSDGEKRRRRRQRKKERNKPMSALDMAIQRRKQVELVERGLADPLTLRRALNDQDIASAAETIEDNILENALGGVIEEVESYLNAAFTLDEKHRSEVLQVCVRLWMNDEALKNVFFDGKRKSNNADQSEEHERGDVELWEAQLGGADEERDGSNFKGDDDEYVNLEDIDMGFGDDGAIAIAQAMRDNTVVKSISLRNHAVGDKGACALAETLLGNTSVARLDLSMNHICNIGATEIAKMLVRNDSIKLVDFRNNLVGDFGARKLMLGLRKNDRVADRKLKLSKNRVKIENVFKKRLVNLGRGYSQTRNKICRRNIMNIKEDTWEE